MKTHLLPSFLLLTVLALLNCSSLPKTFSANENPASESSTVGKIVSIQNLSEKRASHSATLLPNGKVIVIGGMERNGVFFDTAETFDPEINKFTVSKTKMSMARVGHTATLLPNGKILIAGGWSQGDAPEATAEIYDPQTDSFAAIANMHRKRSGQTATLLENGKVLIAGGSDGGENLNDTEIYDPRNKTFAAGGKMSNARSAHSATMLADGKILLTGGEFSRGKISSSAEIYDPKTDLFNATGEMKNARYKHDSVLLKDGRVLIFGGSDARDWNGQYKSAEIYDPQTEKFTATGEMNLARFKVSETSVLLADGNVLIAGGAAEAEIFDPQTKTFSIVKGNIGEPLHYASVTLLKDGRALIVGGYGNGTRQTGPVSTNQAWIFQL